MRIFEKLGSPKSETEATDFILQWIKSLKETDFVQSVLQWNDPKCVADVYGAVIVGQPWFIKFRMDEDALVEEISFHPPNKSMTTVSGAAKAADTACTSLVLPLQGAPTYLCQSSRVPDTCGRGELASDVCRTRRGPATLGPMTRPPGLLGRS